MTELTPDEQDLLARIADKEELQPFFFRKAKGLKWFDALAKGGHFEPSKNPRPIPSKEPGYVNVPFWPATEYLVATSTELVIKGNEEYALKFLELIRAVTKFAVENGVTNYRTWWQFAKVIQHIPPDLIQESDVALFDYWMSDPYDRSLVAEEVGERWLLALLQRADEHCKTLCRALLNVIFKLDFSEGERGIAHRREAILRMGPWKAKSIVKKVAGEVGRVLGMAGVLIFQNRLESILIEIKNDKWSSIWRSAIGDHEQNHGSDGAEDFILEGFRDSLLKYIEASPDAAHEYVDNLLSSSYETVRRVAIYAVDRQFFHLDGHVDRILIAEHFRSNFRHEMWHLLNRHFKKFSSEQQQQVVKIIEEHVEMSEGQLNNGATAYYRAIWLSAIRGANDDLAQRYEKYVTVVGGEPEHPDFSSYMSSGMVHHKSPFSKEELISMEIPALVEQLDAFLAAYKPTFGTSEPDLEGLVSMLREVVKAEPLRFHNKLDKFSKSGLPFTYALIEAYRELWSENVQLPWNEIWRYLLEFCLELIQHNHFWASENSIEQKAFVANRSWVVGGIGRLVEAGTKSDEHAFDPRLLDLAEKVLLVLLEHEHGSNFDIQSDAVFVAINSPRGHCLEALVNLTLRSCRLEDKARGSHADVWTRFRPIYDAELVRAKKGEYEFSTLVVNYLPNFLYMSKQWVIDNLDNIFDRSNYQGWLCAMHGYAYVGQVFKLIYEHLKNKGHLVLALDDDNLKERVHKTLVQHIAIAYIENFEDLSDRESMIYRLIARNRYSELSELIWFIWTRRKNDDEKLKARVLELWPHLLSVIDTKQREGRKLASKMCDWSVFIKEVNPETKPLLLSVVPFANEEYNTHVLLESIARISDTQPYEAYEIWLEFLKGTSTDFPEEAVRTALSNLVRLGQEGVRKARHIVSEYLKAGNDHPTEWLREILEAQAKP